MASAQQKGPQGFQVVLGCQTCVVNQRRFLDLQASSDSWRKTLCEMLHEGLCRNAISVAFADAGRRTGCWSEMDVCYRVELISRCGSNAFRVCCHEFEKGSLDGSAYKWTARCPC